MALPEDPSVLIVNPHARRGRELFAVARERLARDLNLVRAVLPDSPEAMVAVIRESRAAGVRRIIVGGGDGTLSLAAHHLADTGMTLGVLPLGTGNTFAWGLGIPRNLAECLPILREGQVEPLDLGMVADGQGERAFLNTVTLGVSETLVALLTEEAKRRFGWLAWPLALRSALHQTPVVMVTLRFADGMEQFASRQLVVANGRTMAGPIPASPQGSAQDGLLEVFSLGGPSQWEMARFALLALTGRHIRRSRAHYRMCQAVTIETRPPAPLDVDGEVWRSTPVRCWVRPGALLVLTPLRPRPRGAARWLAISAPEEPRRPGRPAAAQSPPEPAHPPPRPSG